ncbi:hypothetical protein, partial [Mycobacterium tuberculosis]
PELMKDGFPVFSTKAVNALNSLMSEDTVLMLTTSHKSNYSILEWKEMLLARGIKANNIQSLDKNTRNLSRKDELLNWFNINEVKED